MARYIDATQLQAKILDAKIANKLPESREVLTIFDNMVRSMPTADVAPKSEVDKALAEFAEAIKLEFYREFDEIIPSIMADKIEELKKKYTEGEE